MQYFLWILAMLGMPQAGFGQSDSTVVAGSPSWHLVVDGRLSEWAPATVWPLDSLQVVARRALASVQQEGYYLAQIDSAQVDSSRAAPIVTLYATRGPRVEIGSVQIEGATEVDSLALLQQMDTRPGRVFDVARLEADLEAILLHYERAGFPLAQVQVADVQLRPGTPPTLRLVLHVREGPVLTLQGVEVVGAERTKAGYVTRVAEVRPGQPLAGYDPQAIQQRLEATTFFREIGPLELLVVSDSTAILRIPLQEEEPGTFDLVLGYQPGTGSESGSLVGNGHLNLRNLFGAGRELSLRLNRLPGQVSSADVRAADPYLFGLPVRVEGSFHGLQQDSTYGKQRYGIEAGLYLGGGFQVFSTLSREATKPGAYGQRLTAGRQRVPRASAFFAGIGIRIQQLDRRVNPRRGAFFETNLEQGRKERTERRLVAEEDTTVEQVERTLLRQRRLRAEGRLFIPTWRRQVAVVGGDARVLLSDEYDVSDLFRFGGATTLRGYDEERFLVPFASRLFVEYRYQLDRVSYGFVFFDLGYVDRSDTIDLPALHGFFPGYGVGFQVGTGVGLINLSLASNPDDPTGVRAHLGLSFGL